MAMLFGTKLVGVRRTFAISPLPLGEAGRRPGEGASDAVPIPCTLTPNPLPEGEGVSATTVPNRIASMAFVHLADHHGTIGLQSRLRRKVACAR
jgi:hypothetical protein